jgi:two-component system, NtrC family, response regulator AtoC
MASRPPRDDSNKHKTEPLPANVVEVIRRGLEQRSRISLIVYHADGAEMAHLLPDLPIIVGRDAPSDLRIADQTLSREHARFTLTDGNKITVEDLSSTNGTWIAGRRIESADLKLGDEVVLGGVLACLHALGPSENNLGLESEERFRVRLDEELVRARHFRSRFSVLMIRAANAGFASPESVRPRPQGNSFGSLKGAADAGPAHVGRWSPAIRALLRPVDRMALYSRYTVQILLPDAGSDVAIDLARTITARRREEDPLLYVGIAVYPDAATVAETLIELSRSATTSATPEQPVQAAPMASWVKGDAPDGEESIVTGPVMRDILETVSRLAQSKIPVILQGETGAGKEVVARLIHEGGPRKSKPMVCVNCGAIAPQLVESALFGHERGAFTGASSQQKGVFEEADGGTVFLDEIGELPLAAQAALLRVLETKRVSRVGSSREIAVDVRIIAATHRDLEAMCEEGAFRDDLYYRMNTMTLTIPPLRDRTEEIEPLALRFLRQANENNRGQVRGIESRALARLFSYRWPGNVRELRNAIERAVVVARTEMIREQDLPARVRAASSAVRRPPLSDPPWSPDSDSDDDRRTVAPTDSGRPSVPTLDVFPKSSPSSPTWSGSEDGSGTKTKSRPPLLAMYPPEGPGARLTPSSGTEESADLKMKLQRYESQLILEALRTARWNQTEAARQLGMPLRTLVHKIKVLGIKKLDR